jgi:hypothetical protein
MQTWIGFLHRLPSSSGTLLVLAGSSLAQVQTVSAGPDRALLPPATSIRIQGSLGDERALPKGALEWRQLAGARARIERGHTLSPRIVPTRAGPILLELRVSTAQGIERDVMRLDVFGDDQDAELAGEARKWHKLALTFTSPESMSETGQPNPFLERRLMVEFFHPDSGKHLRVPGFFAADGNAAESSADAGNRWRVNFTPTEAGLWYYAASFRAGPDIALSNNQFLGAPTGFDGANGSFFVECANPLASGFLAQGQLEYVGRHHLRFAENHAPYLKNGAGSPENFFGYYEFDGTTDQGGRVNDLDTSGHFDGLHHFDAHLGDYVDLGVPLWQGGKGRRIFGALNYLASRGVNSLYGLTYNVDGGDGQEVWPWITPGEKLRFDVSKLAQWERVLDHMTRCGIVWHVITQETENDHVLDGGALGRERRLYYRELVARFAYAPGLVWNLGEENTNTPRQRMAFADHLHAIDPYDHPVAVHNVVGDIAGTFGTLLGTHLEVVSLQGDPVQTPPRAQRLIDDSADAGRPWVVNFDEQTPATEGVAPDGVDFWHDLIRREALWPILMGQGGGCEWYFGSSYANSDLDCENFRSRDNLWLLTTRALDFLRELVPFDGMEHADALAFGNAPSVLARRGEHYVVYLPFGGPLALDLEGHVGPFTVDWFDARNGGPPQAGTVTQVSGPGAVPLGSAPGLGDWAALVRRADNLPPVIESLRVEPAAHVLGRDFAVLVHARDPNGPEDVLVVRTEVRTPAGLRLTTLPCPHRGGELYSSYQADVPDLFKGIWELRVTVTDSSGASTNASTTFEAE